MFYFTCDRSIKGPGGARTSHFRLGLRLLVGPRQSEKTVELAIVTQGKIDANKMSRAWNGLPSFVTSASSLLTFKRYLKTYLFMMSY